MQSCLSNLLRSAFIFPAATMCDVDVPRIAAYLIVVNTFYRDAGTAKESDRNYDTQQSEQCDGPVASQLAYNILYTIAVDSTPVNVN